MHVFSRSVKICGFIAYDRSSLVILSRDNRHNGVVAFSEEFVAYENQLLCFIRFTPQIQSFSLVLSCFFLFITLVFCCKVCYEVKLFAFLKHVCFMPQIQFVNLIAYVPGGRGIDVC